MVDMHGARMTKARGFALIVLGLGLCATFATILWSHGLAWLAPAGADTTGTFTGTPSQGRWVVGLIVSATAFSAAMVANGAHMASTGRTSRGLAIGAVVAALVTIAVGIQASRML